MEKIKKMFAGVMALALILIILKLMHLYSDVAQSRHRIWLVAFITWPILFLSYISIRLWFFVLVKNNTIRLKYMQKNLSKVFFFPITLLSTILIVMFMKMGPDFPGILLIFLVFPPAFLWANGFKNK